MNTNLLKVFPNGAKRTGSNNYDAVLSAFPTFFVQNYDEIDLGFLSYGGFYKFVVQLLVVFHHRK